MTPARQYFMCQTPTEKQGNRSTVVHCQHILEFVATTDVEIYGLKLNDSNTTVELLELVRRMSIELIRLTDEQKKTRAAEEEMANELEKMKAADEEMANELEKVKAVKEELLLTKQELLEARKELLTSNKELLKTQKELVSTKRELQSRITDIEVASERLKDKDRMRRSTTTNVGFTARLTNIITSSLNSHQTLVFDNVYINIGNGYDATTGVFHAPVAGMYVILLTISSVGPYEAGAIEVVHNGVPVCRAEASHYYWGGCPCNAVVHLEVGDTVLAREHLHHAVDQTRGDYFTTFSMGLMLKDEASSS
ncbi:hypothetical protein CHS0354_015842 [Potamilus streckersoni]|uniref:C1q domain-containing protein n=1 Tax=Potamilus streckersoni TaxID=2493646 RepID=A0AAE0VUN0_9BIVA|nr:hypothetical protein CHS0354_015842 [Potamilus streckersoni]